MILQLIINEETTKVYNMRNAFFDFDRNIMRIQIDDDQMEFIERELISMGFPNNALQVIISEVGVEIG